MLAHKRVKLPDHTGVPAQRKLGLDSPLERLEVQLVEPEDLPGRESLGGELAEWLPTPERKSCAKSAQRVLRRKVRRLVQQTLKLLEVERTGLDVQHIAGGARLDRLLAEQLPQLGDVNLKCLRPARGWPVAPEELDQDGRRKKLVRVHEEDREHRAPPGTG